MTFCFAAQPEIEIRWYVEACHHNNVVDPLSDDDEIMFLCGPDIYQFNYLQHGNVKLNPLMRLRNNCGGVSILKSLNLLYLTISHWF